MDLSMLKELGLSDGEIKVYLAVLHIGVSAINEIHEKTGVERRNIYDILNKLIEKGMITYTIEKGKRMYSCSNPAQLSDQIRKREEKLKELEAQIPEMVRLYKNYRPAISAEIYRGKEGMRAILEDTLNYKDVYFIGGGWYVMKVIPSYWHRYNKRRIERGVEWHNLIRYELRYQEFPEKKLMSVRVLPEEFSKNPLVVWIYGNKVVNVLWEEQIFAFMIESKEVAENYKSYHRYLWSKVAKEYK